MSKKRIEILECVTGVIINKHNRVLIAKRNPDKLLGDKWEFPGGKVEKDETDQEALERELFEEFRIQTKTGEFLGTNTHTYDPTTIRVNAYITEHVNGEFICSDHSSIKWEYPNQLDSYDFAEADIPIIDILKLRLSKQGNSAPNS